ncbi:MAG: PEP-CTERM sorting domain-containing protein [Phycisphaerales bacterium]
MKKFIIAVIIVLSSVSFVNAEIAQIGLDISQILGASAAYNAGTKDSTWSGGADGWFLTDTGTFAFFSTCGINSVTVNATIYDLIDTSHDGIASAVSNTANWNICLKAGSTQIAYFAGQLSGNYNEVEVSKDMLEGRAVVTINEAEFNNDFLSKFMDGCLVWNGGNLAGIIANIALPEGTNYQSYATGYSSNNMILTLYADETQIPEPATLTMLALGALSLIRRK